MNKTWLYRRERRCPHEAVTAPPPPSSVCGRTAVLSVCVLCPQLRVGASYLLFLVTVAVTLKKETREWGLVQKWSRFSSLIQKTKARPVKEKGSWSELGGDSLAGVLQVRSRMPSSCPLCPLRLCSVAPPVGSLVYAHHPREPPYCMAEGMPSGSQAATGLRWIKIIWWDWEQKSIL